MHYTGTTFGAVEACGPRWCGKTWARLAHAESVSAKWAGGSAR